MEELELELIDHGLDELKQEEDELVLMTAFEDFGNMQKALEDMGIEVSNAELVRIPSHTKKLDDEGEEAMIKLIDKLEEDDDVVNVFHNMDMEE